MSETEQRKVLAVVYDPAIGKAISRILGTRGYAVEVLESKTDASAKVREMLSNVLADVVITDWTQVDGEEVAKAAKQKGVERVIIMNGGLIGQKKSEELEKSGISIIPKVFGKEELINAVRGGVAKTAEI
jgi:DNA-binding response OmpR family regulator